MNHKKFKFKLYDCVFGAIFALCVNKIQRSGIMGKKTLSMVIFTALVTCWGAFADTEYHDFMDQQGRALRARVLRYDARSMQVTVQTDNGKTATVPTTVFDEEGQQYISEWSKAQEFMDESAFRIVASRKKHNDDSESYGSMNFEQDVEKHSYEITLDNRSAISLKNLKLEYCIYYKQDEVEKYRQVTSEGVLCGKIDVAGLSPKSNQILTTDEVIVYKRTLDADWYYTADVKNVQNGEIEGIWIRMSMTTDTGKTFTRDYCLPDSLHKSRIWTSTPVYAGMNKAPRKNKQKK